MTTWRQNNDRSAPTQRPTGTAGRTPADMPTCTEGARTCSQSTLLIPHLGAPQAPLKVPDSPTSVQARMERRKRGNGRRERRKVMFDYRVCVWGGGALSLSLLSFHSFFPCHYSGSVGKKRKKQPQPQQWLCPCLLPRKPTNKAAQGKFLLLSVFFFPPFFATADASISENSSTQVVIYYHAE